MNRREFIAAVGSTVAWPLISFAAPQSGRVPHIAYLGATSPSSLDPRQIEQFKKGLADYGLIEGRDVVVDYLWAEGSPDRLRQLAMDLAQRDLDVIVTAGPQPVRALLSAKVQTPIVFAIYTDPVADGVVESLAKPGGSMTGLSMANSHLESKRLEILKDAFSGLKRVAILHDPTASSSQVTDAQSGASDLGLELLIFEAGDPNRFENVFADAVNRGANAMAATASPILNFHHRRLIELAATYKLPSIGNRRDTLEMAGYYRMDQTSQTCIVDQRVTLPKF